MSFTALFLQLALTVVFIALAAAGIFWAIRSGQYDDMEGPAQRILMDDDDPMIPFNQPGQTNQHAQKQAKPDTRLKQDAKQTKISE